MKVTVTMQLHDGITSITVFKLKQEGSSDTVEVEAEDAETLMAGLDKLQEYIDQIKGDMANE